MLFLSERCQIGNPQSGLAEAGVANSKGIRGPAVQNDTRKGAIGWTIKHFVKVLNGATAVDYRL
tara:strand:- start:316 stop:507 length:192 start_codon:yes stop_codon:yes gene_type:complete